MYPQLTQTLYVKNEIENRRLSTSVFSTSNHYLSHFADIMRNMGPFRACITLPVETTIDHYSELLASRKHVGDLAERRAMRGFLQFSGTVFALTWRTLLQPKTIFSLLIILFSLISTTNGWVHLNEDALTFSAFTITRKSLLDALGLNYQRTKDRLIRPILTSNSQFSIAARAVKKNLLFTSELYWNLTNEEDGSRSNHYVFFTTPYSIR